MKKQELIEKYKKKYSGESMSFLAAVLLNEILKDLEQLDEPQQPALDNIIHRIKFMEEDLKQEWLSKILKELGSDFELKKFQEGFKSGSWIGRQLINADKIRQKLNKPVVPQFVADYIEFKKENNFHVYGAMRVIDDHYDKRVPEWFYEGNIEKFCLAWILGYEVEEEKRYLIKVKNTLTRYGTLNRSKKSKDFIFSNPEENSLFDTKFTRKELEEANFGWVFDCPGIEIEEVE